MTIENCGFIDNMSSGIESVRNNVTVTNCTFYRNETAINTFDSVLRVTGCVIADNGGGIGLGDSSVRVEATTFVNNAVGFGGSGVANILGCTFRGNFQAFKSNGGIAVLRNTIILDSGNVGLSTAFTDVLVSNCLISGNRFGTAIQLSDAGLTVENTTIADRSGKGIKLTRAVGVIRNSILWNNGSSLAGTRENAQVSLSSGATATIENSIIEGWTGALGGTTNSGLDPMFLERDGPDGLPITGDEIYRLDPSSPGIDTGTNQTHDLSFDYDLDLHPRTLCGTIDLGPYELGVGDLDCDDFVDLFDFSQWDACMNGPAADPLLESCKPFDFNADDLIDLADLAGFQRVFQTE